MRDSAPDIEAILQSLSRLEAHIRAKHQPPDQLSYCLLAGDRALRQSRSACFPPGYFADAAWEILIELYEARQNRLPTVVSDLGLTAQIPPTTALRYVERLIADGYAQRRPDVFDRRRTFVFLTELGAARVQQVIANTRLKLERASGNAVAAVDKAPNLGMPDYVPARKVAA